MSYLSESFRKEANKPKDIKLNGESSTNIMHNKIRLDISESTNYIILDSLNI